MPWKRLRFRDRTFHLDENSLEVVAADDPPEKPAAPTFQHRKAAVPQKPSMLVFNLTHKCNLACDYCFVRNHYPDELPTMPLGVGLKALRLLAPKRPFSISFFGGEPLLAWPQLVHLTEAAISAASHSGVRPRFHVTTNGTPLDEDKVRWLDRHGFSLIVSLDGPQHIHDEARPVRGGGGSFDKVMTGLEAVKTHPGLAKRTTLRGTFTASRLDLVERIEFLNRLCDEGYASSVSVEPASLVCAKPNCAGVAPEHPHAFRPSDAKRLRVEYDALADWWLQRQKDGRPARFFHFTKMLQRLWKRQRACSDCGAGWGYACVNPRGELHACHREGNLIGDVWRGFDEEARAPWLDNRFYGREKCAHCWARNLCGGGCRKDSWDKFSDLRRIDPLTCSIRKTWILEAMYLSVSLPKKQNTKKAVDTPVKCV